MTVGTVFERSKLPLTKWLTVPFPMTASNKGVSAHPVHGMLGISYKSTWFLMHRVGEAMPTGGPLPPMGEGGGIVEIDETYISRVKGVKVEIGGSHYKNVVLSLLDHDCGQVRSFGVAVAT